MGTGRRRRRDRRSQPPRSARAPPLHTLATCRTPTRATSLIVARSTRCTGRPTRNQRSARLPATAPTTSLTHALTGGEFGLYKIDLGPRSPGPTTHFHRTISESFFVLAGAVDLFDGERWVTARRDDFLYVPVGGLHAFKNGSDEPSSMLLLFSPGAPREEYFEQVAEIARRSGEEFAAFLLRHDSYFVDVDGA